MLQRMRRRNRAGDYSFVFAGNGIEALERLRQDGDIDLVLSDINMPRMDGLALLEQIPQVDPNIRSVIISAYGDMQNIRTAMNRGAFDFVTKPVDFEDLTITIDRTMRNLFEWREALSSRDKLVALQNELDVASSIQQSILPTQFPKSDDYQIAANMEPARNVGGDFFDILRLEHGRVGIAVADVSDKGVPAALFMMSSRTLLKGAAIGKRHPRRRAAGGERPPQRGKRRHHVRHGPVCHVRRGDEPGYLCQRRAQLLRSSFHADGSSELLPLTGGIALGIIPGIHYKQTSVTLAPGDTVFFYTDGVTEAMNEDGEEFGVDRLREVFEPSPPTDADMATEAVFEAVHAFAGDTDQSDDITCVTFHRSA